MALANWEYYAVRDEMWCAGDFTGVHRCLGNQHWTFQRPRSWRLMAQGTFMPSTCGDIERSKLLSVGLFVRPLVCRSVCLSHSPTSKRCVLEPRRTLER